jgi:hypothetical protein
MKLLVRFSPESMMLLLTKAEDTDAVSETRFGVQLVPYNEFIACPGHAIPS